MGGIQQINILSNDVKFMNRGKLNKISILINLSSVWERVKQSTDIYLSILLQIPVIEDTLPKSMLLELEKAYKISEIDPEVLIIALEEELPGTIDNTRLPYGEVKIIHYSVKVL